MRIEREDRENVRDKKGKERERMSAMEIERDKRDRLGERDQENEADGIIRSERER